MDGCDEPGNRRPKLRSASRHYGTPGGLTRRQGKRDTSARASRFPPIPILNCGLYGPVAGLDSLRDAGGSRDQLDPRRTAVIVGYGAGHDGGCHHCRPVSPCTAAFNRPSSRHASAWRRADRLRPLRRRVHAVGRPRRGGGLARVRGRGAVGPFDARTNRIRRGRQWRAAGRAHAADDDARLSCAHDEPPGIAADCQGLCHVLDGAEQTVDSAMCVSKYSLGGFGSALVFRRMVACSEESRS